MKCYISNNENNIRTITDYLNLHGFYPENPQVTAQLYHEFSYSYSGSDWLWVDFVTLKNFIEWIKTQCLFEDERFIQLED